MLNLRRFKAAALVVMAAMLCVAQSASEYETPEVHAIADKLNCNCGCKLRVSCIMPPTGVCPTCRQNKIRIAGMLSSGLSEKQILDTYVKEQGEQVLVVPPGMFGFTGPYIALGLGLVAVVFALKYLRRVKPAPAVAPATDAEFARYHDQIEKDLEKLD
jgi:cytochrome c-type biogenesis protein CcmH/NrfF